MLALRNLAILVAVVLSTSGCFALRRAIEPGAVARSSEEFDALLETADPPPTERDEEEAASPAKPVSRKFAIANAERRLKSTVQLPSTSGLRGQLAETDGWRLVDSDRRFLTFYFRRPHWKHRELDSVLLEEDAAAMLEAASESADPLVCATAAIGQARRGSLDAAALAAAVENRELPTSTRCAALETLALAGDQATVDQLYESRAAWMAAKEPTAAELLNAEKLEAELIYALALRQQVRSDARVHEALASDYDDVRAAALDAMYLDWEGELPGEAASLLEDRAERVASAARRTAAPLEALLQSMRSASMSHRRDAVYGMARCGEQAALEELELIVEDAAIVCLIAAIDVWVIRGEFAKIADFASHDEHRVRCAVAEKLAIDRQQQIHAIAPTLLNDSSPHVRDLTLDSLQQWPDQAATAAMLAALRTAESPYSAKVIAERLAARLGESKPAPDETVTQLQARLEKAWRARYGAVTERVELPAEERISRQAAYEMLRLIQQYEQTPAGSEASAVRRQLLGQRSALLATLDLLGPELVEVPLPRLQASVLPEISGDFADWKQTQDADENIRRSALRALAGASRKHELNQYLLEQLAQSCRLDAAEEEMHSILEMVQQDSRPAAARIVGLALHHRASTVRRQALAWCERFTTHDYGGILSTLVTDDERSIRLAAAETLRHYPSDRTKGALLELLADEDDELAVTAAGSLAYLRVPEGVDALNRFSRDRIERTRRLAAEAMGKSGDDSLTPTLIRMLGDSRSVQNAALGALPKLVGEDIAAREKGFRDTNSQVAAWQSWYAEQIRR